jgi:hypothetical protein
MKGFSMELMTFFILLASLIAAHYAQRCHSVLKEIRDDMRYTVPADSTKSKKA